MTIHTRRGYDFEREVSEGLEVAKLTYFKIPDSKAIGRVIPIKVPADFMYSHSGVIYTIEAKQTKLMRIPWKNFREHQIEWVLANPRSAAFVINFNNRENGTKKVNRTFFVTANNILTFKEMYENSVPFHEFDRHCRKLERLTASHHPEKKMAFVQYEHLPF